MSKVRVHAFTISLDGYGAGPDQDLKNPLGVGGMALHEWGFATRTFQKMHGNGGGVTGVDDDFVVRGFEGIGSWILGRNMFGPVRGPWPDLSWQGWWGDEPIQLRRPQPESPTGTKKTSSPFSFASRDEGRHSVSSGFAVPSPFGVEQMHAKGIRTIEPSKSSRMASVMQPPGSTAERP